MQHRLRIFVGYGLMIIGIVALVFAPRNIPLVIQFAEQNISPDGSFALSTKVLIGFIYLVGVVFDGLLGSHLIKIIDLNAYSRKLRPLLFPLVVGIGLFMIYAFREVLHVENLFREDRLFENVTAINFFLSSMIIVITAPRAKNNPNQKGKLISISLLVVAILFLLISLEEISWGQRIIGWETPTVLSGNFKNETNLHNYFRWDFEPFYFLGCSMLLGVVLISSWLSNTQKHTFWTWKLLPDKNLIGFTLLIFFTSLYTDTELVELMLSVYSLFYAARIFRLDDSHYLEVSVQN